MNTVAPPVVASSVTVVDTSGRPRIVFELDDHDDPCVRLLHADGEQGAVLALSSGQGGSSASAHLRLNKGDEGAAVHLSADAAGTGIVEVTSSAHENAGACYFTVERVHGVHEAGLVVGDQHASFGWHVSGGGVEHRAGRVGV